MTRRRLSQLMALAAANAFLLNNAHQNAEAVKIEPRRSGKNYDTDGTPFARPTSGERRKRGGNGKGRKWWNN